MVATRTKPVAPGGWGRRMIYIAGCDGTGKSTQATLMLSALAQGGARVRHVWLRFPFMLSLPLLAFARWRGHSWSEEIDGVRHGYWNFAGSVILRALLPWALLIDAALAAIQKIYLPLLMGHTVVCERFALDMLADLAVAFDEPLLHRTLPARLFPYLVPPGATTVVLDLDAETIRARRSDLRLDRRLEARLEAFGQIAQGLQLSTLSSAQPIEVLHEQLAALANAA